MSEPDIFKNVHWLVVDAPAELGGLPFPTHEGVLYIGDASMRCYRLNDGRAIINAEDFNRFFECMLP